MNIPRPEDLVQARKAFSEVNWRLSFLRQVPSTPAQDPTDEQVLKWYAQGQPSIQFNLRDQGQLRPKTTTCNDWFSSKFPDHVAQYGPAFFEATTNETSGTTPLCLNYDVLAAILSDPRLGLSTIYYGPELQFYYLEPIEDIYTPTTPEKLHCLYRGIMMRCYLEADNSTNKLPLFHQFRDDHTAKSIIHRAKCILSVEESFFSPESPNQRKQGPELPERLGRVFVESMLEKRDGSLLTLTQAYNLFCSLSLQRNLAPIKKAPFKEMMRDLMKEAFGICLRNDVPDQNNKQQQGWKGVTVNLGGEVGVKAE